ncbi:NUF2 [Ecytonucleospora hepatopenaei]|uniref:NUF2 n=1 Tax=Ecytonucleospora hepatopenaei TaxID=646526 RepID=A0A1W0E833_9MICR|nr:hypothetical protein EHP00_2557 [Ecytonucleospora hepatopenaei]OQS55593.1 NUF2 [Ecytonucleospora hepatopenaei]
MGIYNLPPLPQRKLVSYFRDFEIDLSEANLIKPSPAFVQRFYMDILHVFSNKNYASEVESSKAMVNYVKETCDLLSSIGLKNLTIKEIFTPNEKTFNVICTYIANFMMFRDTKKDLYDRALEIADGSNLFKKQLLTKRQDLINIINDYKKNQGANQEKLRDVKNTIDLLLKELKEVKAFNKEKIDEFNELKTKKIQLTDKKCEMEMIEHDLQQDVKRLNLQIVSNPEELLSLVQEMRVLVATETKNIEMLKNNAKQKEDVLISKTKELKKVEKIHEITLDIQKMNEKEEELEQKEFFLKSQIKIHESGFKNKEIRLNHIKRQLQLVETRSESLDIKADKHKNEIAKKLEKVKQELKDLTEQQGENENLKNKNKIELQKLQFEKTKIEDDFNRLCTQVIDLLSELSTKVEINKDFK